MKTIYYSHKNANKIPVLFMMVGLPGSGKSYVANLTYVQRGDKISKPVIHSSDNLREELYGDANDQTDNAKVFQILHKRIKADLQNGIDVIYDATNISKKRRTAFLNEIHKIKCRKVCMCVMAPYSICLLRNQDRERVVPKEAVRKMYLNWCPPALYEGFDDIELVYNCEECYEHTYRIVQFLFGRVDAIHLSHDNPHHSATIGWHCIKAFNYAKQHYPDNPLVAIAALLHDVGKPFTKSNLKRNGEVDSVCHFFNHQNCGAYDSIFYSSTIYESLSKALELMGIDHDLTAQEKLYIADLIYHHMDFFAKDEDKIKQRIGDKMYEDLLKLHEADMNAH